LALLEGRKLLILAALILMTVLAEKGGWRKCSVIKSVEIQEGTLNSLGSRALLEFLAVLTMLQNSGPNKLD